MTQRDTDLSLPGEGLSYDRMPGHWLLAQMGKRVLRPGGLELTQQMLDSLDIGHEDDVVEFAPGLGVTARATLDRQPRSYTGIERNEEAATQVRRYLAGPNARCLTGRVEKTGLPDGAASVVYGEAILSLQPAPHKAATVAEAARVLRAGGRYGIHELALEPDTLSEEIKQDVQQTLSQAVHVGARPLTPTEWRALLTEHGFTVQHEVRAPMHLLEPARFVRDEGLPGTLRFVWNVVRTPAARRRIIQMRSVFRRYAEYLRAIAVVAVKQ